MPLSCQDGDRAGWHHAIVRFTLLSLGELGGHVGAAGLRPGEPFCSLPAPADASCAYRADQPLTAQNVTRALVELSLAQGTRLFDVTAVGRPQATELLQDQMEAKLVRPLMDALGLAPAGRVHIEAIAALVVGAGFMRHRMEAPGLRPLDAGQLTDLLTPAVQALLDAAPRQA